MNIYYNEKNETIKGFIVKFNSPLDAEGSENSNLSSSEKSDLFLQLNSSILKMYGIFIVRTPDKRSYILFSADDFKNNSEVKLRKITNIPESDFKKVLKDVKSYKLQPRTQYIKLQK